MLRYTSLLLSLFVLGCGGNPASQPTSENPSQPAAVAANPDEAKTLIKEYFLGLGLSNLEVTAISEPVKTPSEMGNAWAYSVSLKCDNLFGEKMTHDHWLVVVGEENGKTKVKTHFDTPAKIAESALGQGWFATTGFHMPVHLHETPMPNHLPALINLPAVGDGVVLPTSFPPLPADLPPPPQLPLILPK